MKRVLLALAALLAFTGSARASTIDVAVLDSLQYRGFLYFWNEANPTNGLIKDRDTPGSVCSIASTGFGLSAICIGVEHGWITRDAARTRVLTTLQTFWNGPQGPAESGMIGYKGLYYHWLDMNSARRTWDSELSTIDTALLFAGILHAREFFAANHPSDNQIRALADSITWRADWNWARNNSSGLTMGWHPVSGFLGNRWTGYNEAMIMYILAIGSPTHPVPPSDWNWWCSFYYWNAPFAYVGPYVNFPPLFGHQYSHCWIDFRHIRDQYMTFRGITYFENSRRATLSQLAYGRLEDQLWRFTGLAQYNKGYSDSLWGFTASDDPIDGYAAHGAPNGFDNGTISPTAAISSLPFAPDSVWPCIRNMWTHRNSVHDGKLYPLYSTYGFTDAFNPVKTQWFASATLGIDQGPIVMMIENWRNDMVWARFMGNADVQRGLQLAGFTLLPVDVGDRPFAGDGDVFLGARPNPATRATTLRFRLAQAAHVRMDVYDALGRRVATLADGTREPGEHELTLDGRALPAGVYLCRLAVDGQPHLRKATLLP